MAMSLLRVANKAHGAYWPGVKSRLDSAAVPADQQEKMKQENFDLILALVSAILYEIWDNAEVETKVGLDGVIKALKQGNTVPQDGGAMYKATMTNALPSSTSAKIK